MVLKPEVKIYPLTIELVKSGPVKGALNPYTRQTTGFDATTTPYEGITFSVEDASEPDGRRYFEHPELTAYFKTKSLWFNTVELSTDGDLLVLRFVNPETKEYTGNIHRVTLEPLGEPEHQRFLKVTPSD